MSLIEEIKDKAVNEDNARRALMVLSLNRKERRAIAKVNGTAKIPGVTKPYIRPYNPDFIKRAK